MSNNGMHWLRVGTMVIATSIAPTIAIGIALPGAASAQLFFDWGGQEKVNDTGRQSVRLNVDAKPGEIIVSFTDRKLYLMTGPGQALSYPVAIPREQDRWEGKTTVTQKRENPSWTPTPTMIKENPRLPRWVPGGHPMNPLGNRALYLGSSFYRIHGTDAPWTIGTAVSKGCIRMYNKDALDVYERSKVGAKVLVTWNAYQSTPDGEQAQAAARDEAPAAAAVAVPASATGTRGGAPIPVRGMDRGPQQPSQQQVQVPNSSGGRQSRPDTRYSDVFGTPGPQGNAHEPATDADAAPRPHAPPSRQSRESRSREGQSQREPRRTRETTTERSETVGTAPENAQPVATPAAAARASEPRAKSTSVETGALPERRPRTKAAAPVAEQAQPGETAKAVPAQAQAAPQPDVATRALEAAERAAAAAERAAAAAERAERAVSARAQAPAAAAPAPSPASGSD